MAEPSAVPPTPDVVVVTYIETATAIIDPISTLMSSASASSVAHKADRKLPVGAIAAIAVGGFLFLCGIGLAVFLVLRHQRRREPVRDPEQNRDRDWRVNAFSLTEKDPFAATPDWRNDPEVLSPPEPTSSAHRTSRAYSGLATQVYDNTHHLSLPLLPLSPSQLSETSPTPSSTSFNSRTSLNRPTSSISTTPSPISPTSKATLNRLNLSPLIIPEYRPPPKQAKRTSTPASNRRSKSPPPRRNSFEDYPSSEPRSSSAYSQPSAAAMLSRGASSSLRSSFSRGQRLSDVPPVPLVPEHLKKPSQDSVTPKRRSILEEDFDIVLPPPKPNFPDEPPLALNGTAGVDRQPTYVISNLLKGRNRSSGSYSFSYGADQTPISAIERANSIRPPVPPPSLGAASMERFGHPTKEPYGRRVRRMKQELSPGRVQEQSGQDAEENVAWDSVSLR